MDESTPLTFVTVLQPGSSHTRKQQQFARTAAIRNAVQRKRRSRLQSQDIFIHLPVGEVSSAPLRMTKSLAADSMDPFETLAVNARRLTYLLSQEIARQAGEPVFSMNADHKWQSLKDVSKALLQDPGLVHALCLTLAFATNGGRLNRECLFYRLRAIQEVNTQLNLPDSSAAVSCPVVTTMLLLAGIEARTGSACSTQSHLDGIRQVMLVRSQQGVCQSHAVKRAIFWQDLNCAMLVGTRRIVSHDTFSELHWHRDPHAAHLYAMPFGFSTSGIPMDSDLGMLCGEVSALQKIRDRADGQVTDALSLLHIDNQQAWLESRLHAYLSYTTHSGRRCVALALYICAYMLFSDVWGASLMPSHVSAQLLNQMQSSVGTEDFAVNQDLWRWLITMGASFTGNETVRLAYTQLWGQLTFLKEHVEGVALWLQASGFAALAFDPRNWGASDNAPNLRHHINLYEQSTDLSDAVSYVHTIGNAIDPARIAIWGGGHGGGVCMVTAAIDPRVKAAVFAIPFTSGLYDSRSFPKGHIDLLWRERADKVTSAKDPGEPVYVPIFPETIEAAKANPQGTVIGLPQAVGFHDAVKAASDAAGTPWPNKVTVQTLYHQRRWEPSVYLDQITIPTLYIMARRDEFNPLERHEAAFSKLGGSKEKLVLESENLEAFSVQDVREKMLKRTVDFLKSSM